MKMIPKTIKVTKEDIKNGRRRIGSMCPVAECLRRTYSYVYVSSDSILVIDSNLDEINFVTSPNLSQQIKNYDIGGEFKEGDYIIYHA